MQSLLRWSIENSTPRDASAQDAEATRARLDPEIIDMLLGKSDAEMMKEAMEIAVDSTKTEDERVDALDNLEMLIEQIDNANNLDKIKMWNPLQALLKSDNDAIIVQALWVIGTALQNNPAAQDAYLNLTPSPLSTLTAFLSPNSSPRVRSKAIYTLSGLMKHNAPALALFSESDNGAGWVKLCQALQDPDISVRRKTVFLLNSLLTPNEVAPTSSAEPLPRNLHTPTLLEHPPPQPQSQTSASSTPLTLTFTPASALSSRSTASTALVASNNVTQSVQPPTPHPAPRPASSSTAVAPLASSPAPSAIPSAPSTAGAPISSSLTSSAPSAPAVIHPNSHSAHLSKPTRASTSFITLEAMNKFDILETIIEGLINPLPWGEDGDQGGEGRADIDFEENSVQLLRTYVVSCDQPLEAQQRKAIGVWIDKEKAKTKFEMQKDGASTAVLAERWGMGEEELAELVTRVQ